MNLRPINNPLRGEKLVATSPAIRTYVEDEPRLSRLNYFPGRHLTDVALQREQEIRDRRLWLRGQAVAPGIIRGLEITLIHAAAGSLLEIAPGQALTEAGEDLVVQRTVRVPIDEFSFYDPLSDTLSPRIAEIEGSESANFIAILVLQTGLVKDTDLPLAVQVEEHGTDFTPCDRVPDDESYYRTTIIDAGRFILCRWPDQPTDGTAWRNRVAWTVFDEERAGRALPWHDLGTALAVVAFDTARQPLWIDRFAVAREGGRPRQRAFIPNIGEPRIWDAQFDQFCAELSESETQQPGAVTFERLPPVGALPRAYIDLERSDADPKHPVWKVQQSFFPSDWVVDVAAAPVEQLDAVVCSTRALAPYRLTQRDAVRLLLPVPQQFFDPELLKIDVPAEEFQIAIDTFKNERGTWLAARRDLRNRLNALRLVSTGKLAEFLEPDPKQLEAPEAPEGAMPPGNQKFGVTRSGTNFANANYRADILAKFKVDAASSLKKFSAAETTELDTLAGDDKTALEAFIQQQNTTQNDETTKVNDVGSTLGLRGFIDYLEGKVDEADRLVDSGFLKVKVDVHRLKNLMSNNSLGAQFVASPSLANIVKRRTELVDQQSVNAFASQLLANFAPSAAATATASTGTADAGPSSMARFAMTASPESGPAVAAAAPATGSTMTLAFEPAMLEFVGQPVVDLGTVLSAEQAKGDLAAIKGVVDGSGLTAGQKEFFTKLATAADKLDAKSVAQIATIGKFADKYVEKFDLLSQKQLRAIPLDRLQPPLAPTIGAEVHSGRLEIFEKLAQLGISLAGLTTEFVDTSQTSTGTSVGRLKFHTLLTRRQPDVLSTTDSKGTVVDADESKHFASAVKYADISIAALRAVEKRIAEYREFIARCREYLSALEKSDAELNLDLARVEAELDEARHDVATAQALLAEEKARLDVINARRAQILQEQVTFIIFHRPRAVNAVQGTPVRRVQPALTESPIPACLQEDLELPSEMITFREVFRDSPAKWFRNVPQWLEKVDRREQLRGLLQRAATRTETGVESTVPLSSGRYKGALEKVLTARREVSRQFILGTANVGQLQFEALSWVDLRREAHENLTLSQLIDSGPANLGRQATTELDDLFKVGACLYQGFGRVPGLVRLQWAERFSQFDTAGDFRDLSQLPRWGQVEFTLRRELQLDVDWLFSRVDVQLPEAVDLINDLVRIAMLVASHSPVDQLITGAVIESAKPTPGNILKISVDTQRVRRGMEVILESPAVGLVKGFVEDISTSHVSARVISSTNISTTVTKDMTVRFTK